MYLSAAEAASSPWEEVSRRLLTDVNSGISSREALSRHQIVGMNEFSEAQEEPLWKKYFGQVFFLCVNIKYCLVLLVFNFLNKFFVFLSFF